MEKMKMQMLSVDEIIPYENNPRNNQKAVQVVAKSIREFGFRNPVVVDKNNVVIVGHTRLEASKVLGYKEVPVIIADDLSDEQVKAFRIMDNKSSEFAEWDYDKLLADVNDLIEQNYDIDLTGFDEVELSSVIDVALEIEEQKIEEEKPEVDFPIGLNEEHSYVMLYFDTKEDWKRAKEVFGLHSCKVKTKGREFERVGVGRVVKGHKYLNTLEKAKDRGEF